MPFGDPDDVSGPETGSGNLYAYCAGRFPARGEYLSPEQAMVEGDQGITGERAHEREKRVFTGALPLSRRAPFPRM